MAPKAKQKEVQRSEEEQAAFDEHEQILQKALDAGVSLPGAAWQCTSSNTFEMLHWLKTSSLQQSAAAVLPLVVASPGPKRSPNSR